MKRQRGFGLTGYVAACGLIAMLTITVLWQMERVKTAELKGKISGLHKELDMAESTIETLKTSIHDQQKTIDAFAGLSERQGQRTTELTTQLFDAQTNIHNQQREIDQLRATELQHSLRDPYGAGNLAHNRFVNGLRLIAGTPDRDGADQNSPNTTGTATHEEAEPGSD